MPPLDPTATYTGSTVVQVPASTLTGTYYVLGVADWGSRVAEANETNNMAAAAMRVGPDLIGIGVSPRHRAQCRGAAITVTDTVRNQGGVQRAASATRFYLSTKWMNEDTPLASRPVGPLDAGVMNGRPR